MQPTQDTAPTVLHRHRAELRIPQEPGNIGISLMDFVDFATRSATSKFQKVKEIVGRGVYDPRTDFWKGLRDGLPEYHRGRRTLESLLSDLKDPKKVVRFSQTVRGYKKFLMKNAIEYFKAPAWNWRWEQLSVRVSPELGFNLDGKRYAVKLHFKDEKLTREQRAISFAVMRAGMMPESVLTPAILDVANSRLMVAPPSTADLNPVIESYAVAFLHIWNSLRKGAGNKVQ